MLNQIDLGMIQLGQTSKMTLSFTPSFGGNYALFPFGGNIKAIWRKGPASVEVPENTISAIDGQELIFDVEFTAVKGNGGLQWISINSEYGQQIRIGFDFMVTAVAEIEIPVRIDNLISPSSGEYSAAYNICTGAAPIGYTFSSFTYELTGANNARDFRQCGSWARCDVLQVSDANVCVAFSVQGAEGKACFLCSNFAAHSVGANAALSSVYKLISKAPALTPLK
jgi:hypothetical protein